MMRDERALSGLDHDAELPADARLRLHGLTPREAEVATLSARGYLVREIAERPQVAEGTVKVQLSRARDKLGCRNARELSLMLIRSGIVKPDQLLYPDEHQERDDAST